jgi:hypothetical protein
VINIEGKNTGPQCVMFGHQAGCLSRQSGIFEERQSAWSRQDSNCWSPETWPVILSALCAVTHVTGCSHVVRCHDLTVWHLQQSPLSYRWKEGPPFCRKLRPELWNAACWSHRGDSWEQTVGNTQQLITGTAFRFASLRVLRIGLFPGLKLWKKKCGSQEGLRTDGYDAV